MTFQMLGFVTKKGVNCDPRSKTLYAIKMSDDGDHNQVLSAVEWDGDRTKLFFPFRGQQKFFHGTFNE